MSELFCEDCHKGFSSEYIPDPCTYCGEDFCRFCIDDHEEGCIENPENTSAGGTVCRPTGGV